MRIWSLKRTTKGAVKEEYTGGEPSKVTIVYVSRTHSQFATSDFGIESDRVRAALERRRLAETVVRQRVGCAEAAKKMGDGNKRGAEKLCKIACK